MMPETLRAKALKTLQKLKRVSTADDGGYCHCVSCGKPVHWKQCDGGHFIPKGSSSYWALDVANVWPQCRGCNGFGMKYGSATQQYTAWMIDYFGRDFVEEMFEKKNHPVKFYAADYREMIEEWTEQIKAHERRIGAR